MSKLTKKVVNGKVQFFYNLQENQRITILRVEVRIE